MSTIKRKSPAWLSDAIFYEIYPQSFYDTNGDGIGDIEGIIQKLDYIKDLGCNALWLNPLYESPFMDAGYDVQNYKKVAGRYGTNDDLINLFDKAHELGIKVLLDLVPGHTSDQHPWFIESQKATQNEFSNRYIFTDSVWEAPPEYRLMCGLCERDGNYMVNFFGSQPALNFGFYNVTHPKWQLSYKHPECRKTLEALKDVMRYWLDQGADGFRVDMADSLVKNDDEKIATAELWQNVRGMLESEYPEAALVAEWSNPQRAIINAGFHMDFYLDHKGNGYNTLLRSLGENEIDDLSYFSKNSNNDITTFAKEFEANYNLIKDYGYMSMFTCNHDTPRTTKTLDLNEIKLAYALIFTLPGVPFLYYGDEIGMKYIKDLVSKEGGYHRTGTRTPMQWSNSQNLGFSTASPEKLYLPVDSSKNPPTVASQVGNANSMYETVKKIISLRKKHTELANGSDFKVVIARKDCPLFVYTRGKYAILINPSSNIEIINKSTLTNKSDEKFKLLYNIGNCKITNETIVMSEQSFAIIEVN